MSFWRATAALLAKELRVELRTGEIVVTTGLFATLVAVLASLAFYLDAQRARLIAPGVLWIAIVFAGVLAMGRSWSRERDNDVFRALLLSPVPRAALYVSKLLSSIVFLLIVELVLVIEVAVLFNLELGGVLGTLCQLLVLGTVGLLPVVAPALLCGVVGTRDLLTGVPLAQIDGWLQILGAFDLIFLTAGVTLFEPLVSD